MSFSFLSLNPITTEFLAVGLLQQLSKLNNPIVHLPNNVTLSPIHSAPNVGDIFDNNLTFLNTFRLFINLACVIFVTSDAFKMLLIILQPVLLLLSFILNLTIAILFC
jgi:hypothetical protein